MLLNCTHTYTYRYTFKWLQLRHAPLKASELKHSCNPRTFIQQFQIEFINKKKNNLTAFKGCEVAARGTPVYLLARHKVCKMDIHYRIYYWATKKRRKFFKWLWCYGSSETTAATKTKRCCNYQKAKGDKYKYCNAIVMPLPPFGRATNICFYQREKFILFGVSVTAEMCDILASWWATE